MRGEREKQPEAKKEERNGLKDDRFHEGEELEEEEEKEEEENEFHT